MCCDTCNGFCLGFLNETTTFEGQRAEGVASVRNVKPCEENIFFFFLFTNLGYTNSFDWWLVDVFFSVMLASKHKPRQIFPTLRGKNLFIQSTDKWGPQGLKAGYGSTFPGFKGSSDQQEILSFPHTSKSDGMSRYAMFDLWFSGEHKSLKWKVLAQNLVKLGVCGYCNHPM